MNSEVNAFASETGNFDLNGQRSGIHPLLGKEVRRRDDVYWKGRPSAIFAHQSRVLPVA